MLIAQRKVAREEARIQCEADKLQKQQLQMEAAEQRKITKQLAAEARKAKQYQKIYRARSNLKHTETEVMHATNQEERDQTRSSRFGRQIKPSKQFHN